VQTAFDPETNTPPVYGTRPSAGVIIDGLPEFNSEGVEVEDPCCDFDNETFNVACGESLVRWCHKLVSSIFVPGIGTVYSYLSIRVTVTFANTYGWWGASQNLTVEVRSMGGNSTTLFPLSTWTETGPVYTEWENDATNSWYRDIYNTTPVFSYAYGWLYVIGGSCTAECNSLVTYFACDAGATLASSRPTLDPDPETNLGFFEQVGNGCDVTQLSYTPYYSAYEPP
jgi:hypothetical protein